jgi:hypothetical protein
VVDENVAESSKPDQDPFSVPAKQDDGVVSSLPGGGGLAGPDLTALASSSKPAEPSPARPPERPSADVGVLAASALQEAGAPASVGGSSPVVSQPPGAPDLSDLAMDSPSAGGKFPAFGGGKFGDLLRRENLKKYAPLGVLGGVGLIVVILLATIGESTTQAPPIRKTDSKPAASSPPRDIRAKMKKSEKSTPGLPEETEAAKPAPKSGKGKDALFGTIDSDKPKKDEAKSEDETTGAEDLAEAMRRGLEKQKK